jgi:hypothetical protein
MSRPFQSLKRPHYPQSTRLSGPRNTLDILEYGNVFALSGFLIPDRPPYTLFAIPTALLPLLAAIKSNHNITTRRGLGLAATHQNVYSEFSSPISAAYNKLFYPYENYTSIKFWLRSCNLSYWLNLVTLALQPKHIHSSYFHPEAIIYKTFVSCHKTTRCQNEENDKSFDRKLLINRPTIRLFQSFTRFI